MEGAEARWSKDGLVGGTGKSKPPLQRGALHTAQGLPPPLSGSPALPAANCLPVALWLTLMLLPALIIPGLGG